MQLVRATVHLTERRAALGETAFHHVLAKEVGRAGVVGGLSLAALAHAPHLARAPAGPGARACALLALGAFSLANALYSFLARLVIEGLRRACGAVPVLTFEDARYARGARAPAAAWPETALPAAKPLAGARSGDPREPRAPPAAAAAAPSPPPCSPRRSTRLAAAREPPRPRARARAA